MLNVHDNYRKLNTLQIYYLIISCSKIEQIMKNVKILDCTLRDDPRRVEMDEVLSLYEKFSPKIKILSITSTKYRVDAVSIYVL